MKTLPPEDGLFGLENAPDGTDLPKVRVIPFGLEGSVSYGGGTAAGPEAIIEASKQVELFDEDVWTEPFRHFRLETMAPFAIEKDVASALEQLEGIVKRALDDGCFPLTLGGEHSLTAGAIRPLVKKYGEITLLQFDAHADLRDGYDGEHFSHAAAMRRCLDHDGVSLVSMGIRNISAGEIPFLEANNERITIHWAKDKGAFNADSVINALKGRNVYITFDVDGLDASLMPATGTPEPGGLFWDDVIPVIRGVCREANVVGADICELAPIAEMHSCDFIAAKLAHKILAYKFC